MKYLHLKTNAAIIVAVAANPNRKITLDVNALLRIENKLF